MVCPAWATLDYCGIDAFQSLVGVYGFSRADGRELPGLTRRFNP